MVENKRYKTILFCFVILCLVSTIAKSQDSIQQPIYKNTPNKHGSFYDWAWGTHYRNLYYKPITLKKISIDTIFKKLTLVESLPKLHAFILKDRTETPFLLKPIGGSASFLESNFFQSVYQKEDFKNTYLGDFINEAYTVVHPYMFLVSECLANSAGLGMETSEIAYIAKTKGQSAVTDSLHIQDKLISISQLSDLKHEKQIEDIATLLNKLQRDDFTKVDQSMYIKARLFDMLIGDWNKIPENWSWVSSNRGDSTIYTPQAIDRSYAFTKVDGFLFKELLNMLGVGFITNYCRQLKNIKKFNSLSFPLDIAITQKSNIDVWQSQARILKEQFTDDLIAIHLCCFSV